MLQGKWRGQTRTDWQDWDDKHQKPGEIMKTIIAIIFLLIPGYADNSVVTWTTDKTELIVVDTEPDVLVEFGLIFIKEIPARNK
jgi:hypothetical protein